MEKWSTGFALNVKSLTRVAVVSIIIMSFYWLTFPARKCHAQARATCVAEGIFLGEQQIIRKLHEMVLCSMSNHDLSTY